MITVRVVPLLSGRRVEQLEGNVSLPEFLRHGFPHPVGVVNDRYVPPRHTVVVPFDNTTGGEVGFFFKRVQLPEYRFGAADPSGLRLDQRHMVVVGTLLLQILLGELVGEGQDFLRVAIIEFEDLRAAARLHTNA